MKKLNAPWKLDITAESEHQKMLREKFSPGSTAEDRNEFSIFDSEGEELVIQGDYDLYGSMSKDQARLMAAAPELLEALRGARDLIGNQLSPEGRQSVLDKIEAAIAKAEGHK